MVQFLSIIFFLGFFSIFVGFFQKFPFFLCHLYLTFMYPCIASVIVNDDQ